MFNRFLIFLFISTIAHINCFPTLTLQLNIECRLKKRVCLYIEVFEDDEMYEQLLTRFDGCEHLEVYKTNDTIAQFFHSHEYSLKLPPFFVGSLESTGRVDQFNMTVLITHDCVSSETTKVNCIRDEMYYNGEGEYLEIDEDLTDSGDFGACNERWMGGKLWNEVEPDTDFNYSFE